MRAAGICLLVPFLAGCYLTRKPSSDDDRQIADYHSRLKAAPHKAPQLPGSFDGRAGTGEADLARLPADSVPARFIRACADFGALHCVNRTYGDRLLQVAVYPEPADALGAAGRLAFGLERKGKKGPETGLTEELAISRRGHRLALLTGPLGVRKPRQEKRLRARLESLVKPGGADAGLEFLQTWRRLGIDRSKVRYERGFWERGDLHAFTTPIDAGELFYVSTPKPAELIAAAMQVNEFEVAGGKRLIFTTERYGEVQLILGSDWLMGVQKIEDPARAGQFLDDALYAPTTRRGATPLAPTPEEGHSIYGN